jgi:signal transduction histidine kinase
MYIIAIATTVAIVSTWFGSHALIRSKWPSGIALSFDALQAVVDRWDDAQLQSKFDHLRRSVDASAFGADGRRIASNVNPPFSPPTPDEMRQARQGLVDRPRGISLMEARRDGALLGYVVFGPAWPQPPLWGVLMDLAFVSWWIGLLGLVIGRTLVSPLKRIADTAAAFGAGDMAARTGVRRTDEIGKVASAFDEMSERIARSRETERELLAGLSHELRTPLARIRVATDLAAEGDAATARQSLADVAEDLTELETLLTNVFSTTRLEMAAATRDHLALPLTRAEFDLGALVDKAVAHKVAQEPGRPIRVEMPAGATSALRVYADAILLRRAIENVLDNAHKYSPPGAPVTVSVSQDNGICRVTVADQGFGISAGDLPRVFSPFFRVDRSRTRATGGVGLGLALSKRIVQAHGGTLDIASQLNAGTTVTFSLPAGGPRSSGTRLVSPEG